MGAVEGITMASLLLCSTGTDFPRTRSLARNHTLVHPNLAMRSSCSAALCRGMGE